MSYSIHNYGSMMGDSVRMDAYVQALRRAVNTGSVVLDLGAGTGIFSMLACRFGARKVYAIEPNDAIHLARQLAADNGFADRIEFIQKLSNQVTLPEQVDVIISDLRGALPMYGRHIPSLADARRRFLKPGGSLLPTKDVLRLAVVDAPDVYEQQVLPWKDNHYDFNLQSAQKVLTNSWNSARIKPEQLLTRPKTWATLDYSCIEDPNVKGEVDIPVLRQGFGHGILVWFDATIGEGATFSGGPDAPQKMVYGNGFFPFPVPTKLSEGDRISATIQASLIVSSYVWRWKTDIYKKSGSKNDKKSFNQSTFFGEELSPDTLRKRANSYIPELNEDGRIELTILENMAKQIPLEQIADCLLEDYSNRFRKKQDALAYVGKRSQQYSQ